MTLQDWAFYLCVGVVFSAAAVRGVYAWFRQDSADIAILYTMVAVISIFIIINHGVAIAAD